MQEFKALEAQAIAEAEAEAAAAAAAASVSSAEVAAAAAAGVSDPVSSSSSERTYVVAVDQTGADGNGCPVPVTVRVIGRLADATLVIPTDAVPDARGRIVRELRASNALGPLTQVRVSVAGAQPLGGGQRFEVESVVVDCPPEGTEPAASAVFAARGALDETHPRDARATRRRGGGALRGVGGGDGEEAGRREEVLVQRGEKRLRVERAPKVLPRAVQKAKREDGGGVGGEGGGRVDTRRDADGE